MKQIQNKFALQILMFIGMLGFLPACLFRNESNSAHPGRIYPERQTKGKMQPFIDEAKLVDVPLPLRVVPYTLESVNPENMMLTFTSLQAREDLVVFYQLEMERLGWKKASVGNSASEGLLVFQKPRKLCVISFRPGHQVVLSILVSI